MSDAIKMHEPLEESSELMGAPKRAWWAGGYRSPRTGLMVARVCVLQHVMNTTPRPTEPKESIAFGYMRLNKFHDREPEALVTAIEEIDPGFYETFPRKAGTELTLAFKKAVTGEAARSFYRHGLAAYGKPNLRSGQKNDGTLSGL